MDAWTFRVCLHSSIEEGDAGLSCIVNHWIMTDPESSTSETLGELHPDVVVGNSSWSAKRHAKSTIKHDAPIPNPLSKFLIQRGKTTTGSSGMESELESSLDCKTVNSPCFHGSLRALQV
jgi:hypothetical protein